MLNSSKLETALNTYQSESQTSAARIAVHTLIAGIPYLGSPILEIVNGMGQRWAQERLGTIFEAVKDRVNKIDEEKIDTAFLESEEFQTLLFLTLERLHTTHDKEKLQLFGTALGNASNTEFKSDDKELFIGVLRDLSLNDLRTLNGDFLKGWTPHVHRMIYNAETQSRLFRLQAMGLVNEISRPDETSRASPDLLGRGRINKSFSLSSFGERFLKFISGQGSAEFASEA